MNKSQKRGYHNYTPYFLINEFEGWFLVYSNPDVIAECAKVGIKAGNFLLEDIEITKDGLRKSGLIELLKRLTKKVN